MKKHDRLTCLQYRILKILRAGGRLRPTVSFRGRKCYKMLDHQLNPVRFVQKRTVDTLEEKGRITRSGFDFIYHNRVSARNKTLQEV